MDACCPCSSKLSTKYVPGSSSSLGVPNSARGCLRVLGHGDAGGPSCGLHRRLLRWCARSGGLLGRVRRTADERERRNHTSGDAPGRTRGRPLHDISSESRASRPPMRPPVLAFASAAGAEPTPSASIFSRATHTPGRVQRRRRRWRYPKPSTCWHASSTSSKPHTIIDTPTALQVPRALEIADRRRDRPQPAARRCANSASTRALSATAIRRSVPTPVGRGCDCRTPDLRGPVEHGGEHIRG